MKFVRETRLLVLALVFLSLGGWLLHLRTHPLPIWSDGSTVPAASANWIPFVVGLLNILVAPILLCYARTVIVGYLMNGMSVIIGSILMAVFSLYRLPHPIVPGDLVMKTMFPDIMLLFGNLFVGQQILLHHHPNGMGRMFTFSWWTRHFVYLSVIFALGHYVWR